MYCIVIFVNVIVICVSKVVEYSLQSTTQLYYFDFSIKLAYLFYLNGSIV